MAKLENIYIIVPAFNESKVLEKNLRSLKKYFDNILVIDDGSTDNTLEIVDRLGLASIHHPINLGQGAAIRSGFNFVKKLNDIYGVITFDADGQHSSADAKNFANEILKSDKDIIFGSRFINHSSNVPFIKKFILKIATYLSNVILQMNLSDTHNGLKAFKIDSLSKINITVDRYAFETELLMQISKQKISYKELPTEIVYTPYSLRKGQSIRNGMIILESIIKLILKK